MERPDDVIIIGAPRSGTNMLRDVLTALPRYITWDCDEINLMWRHGNRTFPHDELTSQHATQRVRSYLRDQFDRVRTLDMPCVVEKTCANSLRVEFVHAVKPEARYVFITRDGLDAAASAMQRWRAPFDLSYTAAKARYVPLPDLPYYGARFVANQWHKRRAHSSTDAGLAWWGPKPHDWQELARTRPLDEVCLLQWRRCVEVAERGLSSLPAEQVHRVSYEEFVTDPGGGLRSLLDFLGAPDRFDAAAVAGVKASSVGKGRAGLGAEARSRLAALGAPALERLGYAC